MISDSISLAVFALSILKNLFSGSSSDGREVS